MSYFSIGSNAVVKEVGYLTLLKKKKHKTPKNKTSVESYYLSWEENIKESDKAKTNISPVGILSLCLL